MNRTDWRTTSLRLAALAALSVPTLPASAAIIVSDDFNRTAGVNAAGNAGGLSSWGSNNNALGGATVQAYKVRDTAAGASTEQQFVDGNLGRLRLGHGVVDFDLLSDPDALQNGYRASFDFQRGGGGFVAFAVGITPAQIQAHPQNNARIGVPFAANIPETDFGFLFRPSAASEVWKGGATAVGPAGIFSATSISGSPTTLLNSAVVEITPTVAGQWGVGATINVALSVNGAVSPQYSSTFTSDGSGLGYFGFHSNAGATVAQAGIDNLVITAVPEPSAAVLVMLSLAAVATARRRS
ncbi:MAG: PEP-CTERM sorting domain-containing protein [Lacipirellulaceae bacterium]